MEAMGVTDIEEMAKVGMEQGLTQHMEIYVLGISGYFAKDLSKIIR